MAGFKDCRKGFLFISFFMLLITVASYSLSEERKPKKISLEEVLSIGSLKDDTLYMWVAITTDTNRNIYVADAMDYSLKKFDSQGRFIKKAGRKGEGPGEFVSPRRIAYHKGLIYVTQEQNQGIQVFDEDLNYKDHIPFILPIHDIKIAPDDKIYVTSGMAACSKGLVLVDPEGDTKIDLMKMMDSKEFWSNWTRVQIDRGANLYFASLFEDKIEKLDKQMKTVWSRSLLGKKELKFKKSGLEFGPAGLPEAVVYKDLALDIHENLFILGGDLSDNSSRDIYVLDNQGNYLLTLTLPEGSHTIHIDNDNCLYSSAGMKTIIKKYRLKYQF